MAKHKYTDNSKVAAVFETYPKEMQSKLILLRQRYSMWRLERTELESWNKP